MTDKKDRKRAARDRERFWIDAKTSLRANLEHIFHEERAGLEAALLAGMRLVVHITALDPDVVVLDTPPTPPPPALVVLP